LAFVVRDERPSLVSQPDGVNGVKNLTTEDREDTEESTPDLRCNCVASVVDEFQNVEWTAMRQPMFLL
jgi:hypothetical protein